MVYSIAKDTAAKHYQLLTTNENLSNELRRSLLHVHHKTRKKASSRLPTPRITSVFPRGLRLLLRRPSRSRSDIHRVARCCTSLQKLIPFTMSQQLNDNSLDLAAELQHEHAMACAAVDRFHNYAKSAVSAVPQRCGCLQRHDHLRHGSMRQVL